jgi:hypothetical protein
MSRIAASAFKSLSSLASPISKGAAKLGSAGKAVGFDFGSPAAALGIGVPTAFMAGGVLQQLGGAVKEEFTGFNRDIKEQIKVQRYQAAQAMKARRLQRAMAENMMRLAAANPQLYNQLLVGRTLPTGAVVIGGGQKSDFLESVAYQMATGGFENPSQTPDSEGIMQAAIDSY